jgi:hypothetical protein
MGGRCIDSAPAYVAGRIKHERAKIAAALKGLEA